MLYLFTGNNRYLIQENVQKWKQAFEAKFGAENIIHIYNLETISQSFITETLLARSLFSEKRLVIIDGFPYASEKQFAGAPDLEKHILENLEDIPEETLVIFMAVNPDKRKSAYKALAKLAEIKEFSVTGQDQVLPLLQKKYSDQIEFQALQKLVHYKGGDLQKSISEIEKLLIFSSLESPQTGGSTHSTFSLQEKGGCRITIEHIEKYILPEFEESIFVFIDTVLSKNPQKIFSEFENLLNFSNFYAVYQSLIANLRVFLYIGYLKSKKISPNEMADILKLGNRKFLIQKNYKANFKHIKKLYIDLLNFDKNMKFGKLISSDEKDLAKETESIFLKYISKP